MSDTITGHRIQLADELNHRANALRDVSPMAAGCMDRAAAELRVMHTEEQRRSAAAGPGPITYTPNDPEPSPLDLWRAFFDRARPLVLSYRILVGQIVQALESYDSDDGHNDLVLAGIVSEMKRLEDEYDTVFKEAGR